MNKPSWNYQKLGILSSGKCRKCLTKIKETSDASGCDKLSNLAIKYSVQSRIPNAWQNTDFLEFWVLIGIFVHSFRSIHWHSIWSLTILWSDMGWPYCQVRSPQSSLFLFTIFRKLSLRLSCLCFALQGTAGEVGWRTDESQWVIQSKTKELCGRRQR